jgi:ribosomal protein S18 acetylase RimI-like enzyme
MRPVCADDQNFLFELYCSVRAGEGFYGALGDAQLAPLLKLQFDTRERTYQYRYPDADHHIILFNEKPVGRIFVHRGDQEIRLTDIALLNEYRGQGIGATLIKELLTEADRVNKPVTLHVEVNNPAIHLYERLGFVKKSDDGAYWFMEKLPDTKIENEVKEEHG